MSELGASDQLSKKTEFNLGFPVVGAGGITSAAASEEEGEFQKATEQQTQTWFAAAAAPPQILRRRANRQDHDAVLAVAAFVCGFVLSRLFKHSGQTMEANTVLLLTVVAIFYFHGHQNQCTRTIL